MLTGSRVVEDAGYRERVKVDWLTPQLDIADS